MQIYIQNQLYANQWLVKSCTEERECKYPQGKYYWNV